MPWNPLPITGVLSAWMLSNRTGSYSYRPLAKQIGKQYHIAAATVETPYGAPVVSRGSALTVQLGFEASFQLAQDWITTNIGEFDYTVKQWNNDIPDTVWIPAAKGVVRYWTGAQMATAPPPPGGGAGVTNPVLLPGLTVPLNSAISAAFKIGRTVPLCTALNVAFIAHLKTTSGLWTGFTPSVPPAPFAFPWVTLV